MSDFRVIPAGLNLRSSGVVEPGNIIAVLPQGQIVTRIGSEPDSEKWWRVRTTVGGNTLTGFVSRSFLSAVIQLKDQPPKAMAGHGTYIYNAAATIKQYGSPEEVAAAMHELDMQHAWVRIHGRSEMHALEPTRSLIQALKAAEIYVAGWGWCQGDKAKEEAQLALNALDRFELEHYIADIEQGVSGAHWTETEINQFFTELRSGLSNTAKVALSTHAFIIWHGPELMETAEKYVDYFAPQVYWFYYPSQRLLDAASVNSQAFPLDNPVSYMRLCIKLWRDITEKPLIVAGQAYWGEGDFPRNTTEHKLKTFINTFSDWTQLQGLNWWHLGGKEQSAMSSAMYSALKEATLNSKFPRINLI
jgi:hypothetical protein